MCKRTDDVFEEGYPNPTFTKFTNTTEVRATECWRMSTIGTSVDNSELLFNFFTKIGIIILMTLSVKRGFKLHSKWRTEVAKE